MHTNGVSIFFICLFIHIGWGLYYGLYASFIILFLVIIHLLFLNETRFNNPTGIISDSDKILFHPYYTIKDGIGLLFWILTLMMLVLLSPDLLGDPDNYTPANPLSISPISNYNDTFYLLNSQQTRRHPSSYPLQILVLAIIAMLHTSKQWTTIFCPFSQIVFWLLVADLPTLTWIGS